VTSGHSESGSDERRAVLLDVEMEYKRQVFRWAAERLRDEFRGNTWAAFWETAVEGKRAQGVADKLGMSVGAVYMARSRVVARLKLTDPQREAVVNAFNWAREDLEHVRAIKLDNSLLPGLRFAPFASPASLPDPRGYKVKTSPAPGSDPLSRTDSDEDLAGVRDEKSVRSRVRSIRSSTWAEQLAIDARTGACVTAPVLSHFSVL
jgi:hypothetical protein